MSYNYTYHYGNGRRAIVATEFPFKNDKDAIECGINLARMKRRKIEIRKHTSNWYNDKPRSIGVAYPNGEFFDGYGIIGADGKRREITEADYHYVR